MPIPSDQMTYASINRRCNHRQHAFKIVPHQQSTHIRSHHSMHRHTLLGLLLFLSITTTAVNAAPQIHGREIIIPAEDIQPFVSNHFPQTKNTAGRTDRTKHQPTTHRNSTRSPNDTLIRPGDLQRWRPTIPARAGRTEQRDVLRYCTPSILP